MPLAAAAPLNPVNFMCSVPTVIMRNGDRYPVVTAVVQSVRTIKPVSGLTGNRPSYCLFFILWLPLHCHINLGR
jgi:hypothetical protein